MKLVTVGIREFGHNVTCSDLDRDKVEKMRKCIFPVYEPGLSEVIMKKNKEAGRLAFTCNHEEGFNEADVIFIDVSTPENEDGSTSFMYVEDVATTIALTGKKDTIVVTKSTVPDGTNDRLQRIIDHYKLYHIPIGVAEESKNVGSTLTYRIFKLIKKLFIWRNCLYVNEMEKDYFRHFSIRKKTISSNSLAELGGW